MTWEAVLPIISDDVETTAFDGVDGVGPCGVPVRIFRDPVALLGDYPAIASVSHVLRHVANTFCMLVMSLVGGTSRWRNRIHVHDPQ